MRDHILIVDDEPLLRMQMADIVSSMGFVPLEADSTVAAMHMLADHADALAAVITDIGMPGTRNGVILANQIKFGWPDIKVIVVSGAFVPKLGDLPNDVAFYPKPVSQGTISSELGARA